MMQPAEPRHGNDLRRHHGADLLAAAGLKLPCPVPLKGEVVVNAEEMPRKEVMVRSLQKRGA
jgi:hypothetical protein